MVDDTLNGSTEPEEQEDAPTSDWEAALAEQHKLPTTDDISQTPQFDELGQGVTPQDTGKNLNFLLDIPLNVSVELGRTSMIIHRMLQLTQGSVVELDKVAGEPVEIYINNKLLGKGEVVVVNDRFGVRITEIISQADRIKNMG